MAFKFYNVHRTNENHLEDLLNDHAERGWDLHYTRSVGAANLVVTFVRTFADVAAKAAYLKERAERKAARRAAKSEGTNTESIAAVPS